MTRYRPTSTRLLVVAYAALVVVLAVWFWAQMMGYASAHTPSVSATCERLDVRLDAYNGQQKNRVHIEIDGVEVVDEHFRSSYSVTVDWSRADAHTWTVRVDAHDDPSGRKGWSFTLSGTSTPCPATTTTVAPTTTTVAPTTTTVAPTTTTEQPTTTTAPPETTTTTEPPSTTSTSEQPTSSTVPGCICLGIDTGCDPACNEPCLTDPALDGDHECGVCDAAVCGPQWEPEPTPEPEPEPPVTPPADPPADHGPRADTLPVTGYETSNLVTLGIVLVVLGVGLVICRRFDTDRT